MPFPPSLPWNSIALTEFKLIRSIQVEDVMNVVDVQERRESSSPLPRASLWRSLANEFHRWLVYVAIKNGLDHFDSPFLRKSCGFALEGLPGNSNLSFTGSVPASLAPSEHHHELNDDEVLRKACAIEVKRKWSLLFGSDTWFYFYFISLVIFSTILSWFQDVILFLAGVIVCSFVSSLIAHYISSFTLHAKENSQDKSRPRRKRPKSFSYDTKTYTPQHRPVRSPSTASKEIVPLLAPRLDELGSYRGLRPTIREANLVPNLFPSSSHKTQIEDSDHDPEDGPLGFDLKTVDPQPCHLELIPFKEDEKIPSVDEPAVAKETQGSPEFQSTLKATSPPFDPPLALLLANDDPEDFPLFAEPLDEIPSKPATTDPTPPIKNSKSASPNDLSQKQAVPNRDFPFVAQSAPLSLQEWDRLTRGSKPKDEEERMKRKKAKWRANRQAKKAKKAFYKELEAEANSRF